MGGVVKVSAGSESYKAKKGTVFGSREILASMDITRVESLSHVVLLYLTV